jgi:gamma-glutamyltranspeptidase/glutathione hydrolase
MPRIATGTQALHDRFGKIPFAELLGPAVWIAEHGVPLSPAVGGWLRTQGNFATRLPEGKRIFTKENGDLYKTGDVFRQPELAATLKKVACMQEYEQKIGRLLPMTFGPERFSPPLVL